MHLVGCPATRGRFFQATLRSGALQIGYQVGQGGHGFLDGFDHPVFVVLARVDFTLNNQSKLEELKLLDWHLNITIDSDRSAFLRRFHSIYWN